jgi:NFU1 iron-sulfur cluster scaffold homolog, mitochondrial
MHQDDIEESEALSDRIESFIDSEVRPFIQQDGGDIDYHGFNPQTGMVRVMLQGACSTCPSSIMTLRFGVELRLREAFPEVKGLDVGGMLFGDQ